MRCTPTRPPSHFTVLILILSAPFSLAAERTSRGTDGIPPLAPDASLERFSLAPRFQISLVCSEPLIADPVAIDWGPDGALWVVEMRDYPAGLDGNYKVPGGRVRRLTDEDGDGLPETATTFLDGLSFPTGVMAWRGGVLVCAAPSIIFSEDTDGDGAADRKQTLLSGFATTNYQARVNGLEWGLDGWIYGANGLLGGSITTRFSDESVSISGRDFRFHPESLRVEAIGGLTQQGRTRNDSGDAFGCVNGVLLKHYPIDDRWLSRNPHVASPPVEVNVSTPAAERIHAPDDLVLFELSGAPGRATSACGAGVYRDDLLGEDLYGDAFTCEPVHQVVHRTALVRRGMTFVGSRAPEESTREFLSSSDRWFRPVQARTGPDGALWIVDMYRYVIEHPRWIPAARRELLDLRAGSDRGRIWRIAASDRPLRRVPRLDATVPATTVARTLQSANGTVRDLAHRMLVERRDLVVVPVLEGQVELLEDWRGRLHSLCALDSLDAVRPAVLREALRDSSPAVRRHAARIWAKSPGVDPLLDDTLLSLAQDSAPQVVAQVAAVLGEWEDRRAGHALAEILSRDLDPWTRALALSSIIPHRREIRSMLRSREQEDEELAEILSRLESPEPESVSLPLASNVGITRDSLESESTREIPEVTEADVERIVQALPAESDLTAGAELFSGRCSRCHFPDAKGHRRGPNLAELTDRSRSTLLTEILLPNRAVLSTWRLRVVELASGQLLEGLVSSETSTSFALTPLDDRPPRVLLRRDVRSIRETTRSPMPDGLTRDLSPQLLAALLDYIGTLAAASGSDDEESSPPPKTLPADETKRESPPDS